MPADGSDRRAAVLAAARRWLGTPFIHAQAAHGVGVDCAGLLRAVYAEVGLVDLIVPPNYGRDWFLHRDDDLLRQWVARYCRPTEMPGPGDIALFSYGRCESHAAIIVEWGERGLVIHSYRGRGVIEEECCPGAPLWARFRSAWTFPAFVAPPGASAP